MLRILVLIMPILALGIVPEKMMLKTNYFHEKQGALLFSTSSDLALANNIKPVIYFSNINEPYDIKSISFDLNKAPVSLKLLVLKQGSYKIRGFALSNKEFQIINQDKMPIYFKVNDFGVAYAGRIDFVLNNHGFYEMKVSDHFSHDTELFSKEYNYKFEFDKCVVKIGSVPNCFGGEQ